MAMRIVENECQTAGHNRVIVTLEGNSITEVSDSGAKHAAITKAAQMGYPISGISSQSGAYMIGADGKPIIMETAEDVERIRRNILENRLHGVGETTYRNEFTLIKAEH